MTVSIHVEGPDAEAALSELRRILGGASTPQVQEESHGSVILVANPPVPDTLPIVSGDDRLKLVTDAAPAVEKKRGRPKKSEAPASSPAQPSDTTATAAPPSTVAELPTPEPTQIPPVSAEAPASLSFDEFRSKLLDIANLKPDVNMAHCTKALNDEGFSRVKDMKDAGAEVYAKVLARAAELVAAA